MINQSNAFNVNLNQFSGPLDLLLDLAKSQKVKIEDISITKLADQFLEYIKEHKNLNLDVIPLPNLTFCKSSKKPINPNKINVNINI